MLKGTLSALAGTTASCHPLNKGAQDEPLYPRARDTLGLLEKGKKIPIIFDSDIGGDIDDTWALLMALNCPELDIRLFVTDSGLGTSRARLAAKYLEICGRTDVPAAVGVPVSDKQHNQSEWVGDYRLKDYPGTIYEDGVGAIVRTIKESTEPVTLVAIGGVPTVAAALKRDPSIVRNARFVGMHGSIRKGYGGSSKPVPEANVRANPRALAEVFAAPWECTVTPLDTCGIVQLKGGKYQKVYQDRSPAVKALMENYRIWLPKASWMKPDFPLEKMSTTLFDLVAVYLAFSEKLLNMEELPIRVTDKGMTVVDKSKRPIRCAMSWKNLGAFEDLIVERIVREP